MWRAALSWVGVDGLADLTGAGIFFEAGRSFSTIGLTSTDRPLCPFHSSLGADGPPKKFLVEVASPFAGALLFCRPPLIETRFPS